MAWACSAGNVPTPTVPTRPPPPIRPREARRFETISVILQTLGLDDPDVSERSPMKHDPDFVWRARVVVVSDGVAVGIRKDRSGPALQEALERAGAVVEAVVVTPDGIDAVADILRAQTADFHGLVVTTGGTGFGPRDLTPEGTRQVVDREAPGLAEAARLVNPLGRLSRGIAGSIGTALVLNLPGSRAGAVECFEAVADVVPHILRLLAGEQPH